ncbi:DUF817 domain-containing protein [Paenibacillus pasadenensis]|uniref:Putative membrane protein n=1 Tax=Paenibacillus pasadenensis TaxID=217090 RepID=A0A2N5NDB4_9BACL|nr:putative membrane protein [Paenibacillus pasadenensis]
MEETLSGPRRPLRLKAAMLLDFGRKQALSCAFPVLIFASLGFTKLVDVPGIARYDLLLLLCLAIQAAMLLLRLETARELQVVLLFHLIGLMLELFKVRMGSWSYPGEGWSKIGGVPLYSGFMYASVASYMCQAWRRLELSFRGWPDLRLSTGLALLAYANFFTHHWLPDLRWWLTAAIFAAFWRASVSYTAGGQRLKMPVLASFALIALFIWLAENVSTFLGAWAYPDQRLGWSLVHWGKLSSWFLLVILSLLLVYALKRRFPPAAPSRPEPK